MLDDVRRYRRAAGWRGLAEFADLLALDNQTHDVAALRRNADAIAGLFTARGADMEILHLEEHDSALAEGSGHAGMSALGDLVARKR